MGRAASFLATLARARPGLGADVVANLAADAVEIDRAVARLPSRLRAEARRVAITCWAWPRDDARHVHAVADGDRADLARRLDRITKAARRVVEHGAHPDPSWGYVTPRVRVREGGGMTVTARERERAAVYHRVSTADQSPALARDELRQAAKARGFAVALEIEETGSGARPPGFGGAWRWREARPGAAGAAADAIRAALAAGPPADTAPARAEAEAGDGDVEADDGDVDDADAERSA